jgi:hypothetical protein
MPDIFIVDANNTNALQQQYERVIEALLLALLDNNANNLRQGLQIFDEDRLVYGRDGNEFHDEISSFSGQLLNPELIAQLQQVRSTPVGEIAEGVVNKRVELDGDVVLQSDKDGRVIVNSLLQAGRVKSANSQALQNQDNIAINNNNETTNRPEVSSQNIKQQEVNPNYQQQISGSTRVMQSLQALENSPLRTLLSAEIEQLQAEIKALQHERSLYEKLVGERLKQPQNASWWQQLTNNITVIVGGVSSALKMSIREFQENSIQHQFATSIKNLFHLHAQPGASQYQAGNYQIERSGSLYELKELATGKQIMQFHSTPLGLKVEKGDLKSINLKDINTLQSSLYNNEPIPASFAPVGKQEAEYFARVDKVTNALIQYAAAQQRDVEIDGAFSYKWEASPGGKVQIDAKDGRGTLLEKFGGQLKSNMSERDLIYFEQILPKLQAVHKQKYINNSHQVTNNTLSR